MEETTNSFTQSDYVNQRGSIGAEFLDEPEDRHEEGTVTKAVEKQTAKIPSLVYLALAIGSMVVSAAIAASSKRKDVANFVGLWAPSFLMLGIYNKIVKTQGSDSQSLA